MLWRYVLSRLYVHNILNQEDVLRGCVELLNRGRGWPYDVSSCCVRMLCTLCSVYELHRNMSRCCVEMMCLFVSRCYVRTFCRDDMSRCCVKVVCSEDVLRCCVKILC